MQRYLSPSSASSAVSLNKEHQLNLHFYPIEKIATYLPTIEQALIKIMDATIQMEQQKTNIISLATQKKDAYAVFTKAIEGLNENRLESQANTLTEDPILTPSQHKQKIEKMHHLFYQLQEISAQLYMLSKIENKQYPKRSTGTESEFIETQRMAHERGFIAETKLIKDQMAYLRRLMRAIRLEMNGEVDKLSKTFMQSSQQATKTQLGKHGREEDASSNMNEQPQKMRKISEEAGSQQSSASPLSEASNVLAKDKEYFVRSNTLTIEGMLLILEYYREKNILKHKVFLAIDQNSLLNTLALFAKSAEQKLTILYWNAHHARVYFCEKKNEKNYVVVVDSVPNNAEEDFENEIDLLMESNASLKDQFVFFRNVTTQQTRFQGCHIATLKNLNKIHQNVDFLSQVMEYSENGSESESESESKNESESESESEMEFNEDDATPPTIHKFHLPPDFIHLVQSRDTVEKYLEEDFLRDKEDLIDQLRLKVYKKRNKFGVETPQIQENRHYDASAPNDKQPQYIYRNLTVEYFNKKYIFLISALFEKTGAESVSSVELQKRLQRIVNSYEAIFLRVHPLTKELYNIVEPPQPGFALQPLFSLSSHSSLSSSASSSVYASAKTGLAPQRLFPLSSSSSSSSPKAHIEAPTITSPKKYKI